ncbi:MAG: DUF1549 domain-containing protein [Acidobacteria bacterium]|nr:DUF1549 domain-containing protein [Acidobacteriota bacterium]
MIGTKYPVRNRCLLAGSAVLALSGFFFLQAQEQREPGELEELQVEHADCVFLGPSQSHFKKSGLEAQMLRDFRYSRLTMEVTSKLAAAERGVSPNLNSNNVIDRSLFQVWKDANVTPADKTNDFEFIRRVTLDLTGRAPAALRVQQFVADIDPDKRARLVEELLNSPAWADKWSMFLGDLFKNTVRTTQVIRYPEGRTAFHQWINKVLSENRPYNQITTDLITAAGSNSYTQGELNWMIGGFVTGGPQQDIWDQQAVNVAVTFLGIAHMNCVMCHDGRRHLDTLSLWGKDATRYQGYQLSAFFSHTAMARVRVSPQDPNPYYWSVEDRLRTDYALGSTTGNRPERKAVGTLRVISPEYPFDGNKPRPGENYRAALARDVTGDFQFARNTVNRFWKEFMTKAFVEPVDQFDLARLDPDNPPPDPWQLQPNQPRLLNALAQEFINSKYDLKALMRTIVTSEAYQLSSRYNGEWNPAWENLYARHLARRMWAEELHDAVVLASNVPVSYNIRGFGIVNSAMKLPDVVNTPGGDVTSWLDSFMRGNRDNEDRRSEGSTLQALNLMNDVFVLSRTRATGTGDNASLLRKALTGTDEQLVSTLYINVLSRYPDEQEKAAAYAALKEGNRQQKAEDLLWALFNKVDFIFNY